MEIRKTIMRSLNVICFKDNIAKKKFNHTFREAQYNKNDFKNSFSENFTEMEMFCHTSNILSSILCSCHYDFIFEKRNFLYMKTYII